MTASTAELRHQIGSASDLQSVVRTMRALAAASIHQYEQAVLALADYRQAVNLGLGACLRDVGAEAMVAPRAQSAGGAARAVGAIVFGSDQGLVGAFNEAIVEHATSALQRLPGPAVVWAVGERVQARLQDAGVAVAGQYAVPSSVEAIAPLVDRLQFDTETHASQGLAPHIHIFYNRPHRHAMYEPVAQRLLPLDEAWRMQCLKQPWPGAALPELIGRGASVLKPLIREHLFISLYRACAESLASENASRLAAMERADKNIDELLTQLRGRLHGQRQAAIDEELFDLVAGYEALTNAKPVKAAAPS